MPCQPCRRVGRRSRRAHDRGSKDLEAATSEGGAEDVSQGVMHQAIGDNQHRYGEYLAQECCGWTGQGQDSRDSTWRMSKAGVEQRCSYKHYVRGIGGH